jgi:hypothetical protein
VGTEVHRSASLPEVNIVDVAIGRIRTRQHPERISPAKQEHLAALRFAWSTRPDSRASKLCLPAIRLPSGAWPRTGIPFARWQGDAGIDFIEFLRLKRSDRVVSVN